MSTSTMISPSLLPSRSITRIRKAHLQSRVTSPARTPPADRVPPHIRPSSSSSSSKSVSAMPLFMAYCPDYPTSFDKVDHSTTTSGEVSEGDTYAKRLSVRQRHWARAQEDKQAGRLFFGLGYLPPADSPIFTHPARSTPSPSSSSSNTSASPSPNTPQPPAMAGSLMLMHYPDLASMWDRIKSDVYWTEGVWDREKTVVHEFISAPIPAPAPAPAPTPADGQIGAAMGKDAGGAKEREKGAEDSQ